MATLSEIKTDCISDLQRPDLADEIVRAINDAIRNYSSTRFWFNQSRTLTFNTIAGQSAYSSADNSQIDNIMEIDQILLTDGTTRIELGEMDATEYEFYAGTGSDAVPQAYSWFNQELRLYPTPDNAYPVRVMGFASQDVLTDDMDTNVFTQFAEALIRISAKRRVLSEVMGDQTQSQVEMLAQSEQLEFQRLIRETTLRSPTTTVETDPF